MRSALLRRAFTLPSTWLSAASFLALLPALLVVAALVDVVRRKAVALRLLAFVGAYLAIELGGQARLLGAWLASGLGRDRDGLRRRTYGIQAGWAGRLFAAATRIWGLNWEVEGCDAIGPAPTINLVRHCSLLDTLVPTRFITAEAGIPLRFVLKRELLYEPCLDIAGHWLANHFVDRDPDDSAAEIDAIEALARGLEAGEGLLIYPEGTRFTPSKRARVVARLEERDPELAERARDLQRTLLPRAGGTLALLRAQPRADVVLVAHHGLEGFATVADMWSGGLIGRSVTVEFRRFAHASIPDDDDGRREWLYTRWAELDRWIRKRSAP